MIAKHIHCLPEHDNYARLAAYIADTGHDGEKCLASWCAGCATDDDYKLAVLEAEAVQSLNTRTSKEKTYHLMVSFRAEDEDKLTAETCRTMEEHFAAALGFSEHQRHCGIHKNTGNIHMHVAYNSIHPETLTRHDPYFDYSKLSSTCRQLEQSYSLAVDNGMEQARGESLSHKAATIEAQTGQESFESYAKRHKAEILQVLEQIPNGQSGWQLLHESMRAYGVGIKPHGNGLVIIDLHGKHTAKASTVDRSLSAKRLQERFGEFKSYRSLRQIQELSRYQAVPLHRAMEQGERGELYSMYKTGIENRKSRLADIKEREDKQLTTIRQEWENKRREIEKMNIDKRNRLNLLSLAKKHEKEAIAKAKLSLLPEREAVRSEIPFTSWQDFLKQEAESGNEIALAVLRSRKEPTEPEQAPKQSHTPAKAPKKDWSKHGMDYAIQSTIRAEIRAEYAEKERELQERSDISASSKKSLQAFLCMEQVVAESHTHGSGLGEVKRRVDGKGIIIFTLEGGGIIKDTGKEIFYSSHDPKAQSIAENYAAKKWGKRLVVEKGHIRFQPEYEIERPSLELPQKQKGLSR